MLTLATPGPFLSGAYSADAGRALIRVTPTKATPEIRLVNDLTVIFVINPLTLY